MTTLVTLRARQSGAMRTESIDGREHLVVPVVALVAGVVNGERITTDELSRFPQAWNGRPIPVGHPQRDGIFVSASDPDLERRQNVGRLYNARFENDALQADMWLDVAKVNRLGHAAVIQRLRFSAEPMEVSTAYYCDTRDESGEWKGKTYSKVQVNLRPDHLALLPNEKGACSVQDGCGAPRVHTATHNELREALHNLLRGEVPDGSQDWPYVVDVLDEATFIYETDGRLYRRAYAQDGDAITLGPTSEVTEVSREISYVTANTSRSSKPMKELIDKLITNDKTPWQESDRATLERLSETQLKSLSGCGCKTNTGGSDGDVGAAARPALSGERKGTASDSAQPGDAGDAMPPERIAEMRERLARLEARETQQRTKIIDAITATKVSKFTTDELNAMETDFLEKLLDSLRTNSQSPPQDYTGRAPLPVSNSAKVSGPPPVVLAPLQRANN